MKYNFFFTAGYPKLNSTLQIIDALQKCQVDFIEIGMPYSDPLADGPTIQESSKIALNNGMTIDLLFKQLHAIPFKLTSKLILMGYLNPVLQYGYENFCSQCALNNIYGLIIPDLTLDDYYQDFKKYADKYNIKLIFLITPDTPKKRIIQIDKASSGFLYIVSSTGTTGKETNLIDCIPFLKSLQVMKLRNQKFIGFGIKSKDQIDLLSPYIDGVIIGTAFIKALQGKPNLNKAIRNFVSPIVQN